MSSSNASHTYDRLRAQLGLSLTQPVARQAAEFAADATLVRESWSSRIEKARAQVPALAEQTDDPEWWEKELLRLLDAAHWAGIRLWLWDVLVASKHLTIELPEHLRAYCALVMDLLPFLERAFADDEDQDEAYCEIHSEFNDEMFAPAGNTRNTVNFHQWADLRILDKIQSLFRVGLGGHSTAASPVDWEHLKNFSYFRAPSISAAEPYYKIILGNLKHHMRRLAIKLGRRLPPNLASLPPGRAACLDMIDQANDWCSELANNQLCQEIVPSSSASQTFAQSPVANHERSAPTQLATDQPHSDGLEPPNILRWQGDDKEISIQAWKLLDFMWNRKSASYDELKPILWPDEETQPNTLNTACHRCNGVLPPGFPWKLGVKDRIWVVKKLRKS